MVANLRIATIKPSDTLAERNKPGMRADVSRHRFFGRIRPQMRERMVTKQSARELGAIAAALVISLSAPAAAQSPAPAKKIGRAHV